MTTPLAPRTIVNPVIRDQATFLELSAETDGKHSLIQIELAPGGGNAVHFHRALDETFRCVDGTLGVQVGKATRLLAPGQSATVRAGEVHRFFNPSADRSVTFEVRTDPGSPGFERMLQVAYGLAADGLTNRAGIPKNPYHTALIIHWGDTSMPGLLSLLGPLFRWLAARALKNGIADALIDRYCRY